MSKSLGQVGRGGAGRIIDIRPTKSLGLILGLMHQIKLKTRLPGAVPQPLFLLFIVFGCIIFFEVVFHLEKK